MYWRIVLLVLIVFFTVFNSLKIRLFDLNEEQLINVEVKGYVDKPGVYTMPQGSTLGDLLSLCGINKSSDVQKLSLGNVLYNDQIIIIPASSEEHLVSINNASVSELAALPGIGKSIALKIIEYRKNSGSFRSIEEIMNVSGIGNAKFNKIREYITL